MKRSKLFRRTLAVEVALFGLIAIACCFFSGWNLYQQMSEDFQSKGKAIASSLANTSVELLLNMDVSTVQSDIDQFIDPAGRVSYVYVVNDKGEIISHTFVPEVPARILELVKNAPREKVNNIINLLVINDGESYFDISAPILGGEAGYVHVGMNRELIQANIKSTILGLIFVIGIIFILSTVGIYFWVRSITNPLGRLTLFSRHLAEANLIDLGKIQENTNFRGITNRKDEIGELGSGFQYMVQQLLANQLKLEHQRQLAVQSSHELKTITTELSGAVLQQANRSQQQASEVLEVTATLQQLGQTSKQIAGHSNQVKQVTSFNLDRTVAVVDTARITETTATEGQEAVTNSITSIEEVRGGINNLKSRLAALDENSKQINSIIYLIEGIANETHLLALNAAIESAGAGEYGERFAVVADEVKKLADHSKTATRDVRKVIDELHQTINTALEASEESSEKTFEAIARSQKAGRVINELASAVKEVTGSIDEIVKAARDACDRTDEISISTEQQSSAVKQIIDVMKNIGQVAGENSAVASQITVTAKQMDELSARLKETLDQQPVLVG